MVLQCTSEDDHWDYHWNDIWIIHSIGKLYLDISNNTMEIRTTSNSHYFISNIRTAMDYWKLDFIFYVLYIYIFYILIIILYTWLYHLPRVGECLAGRLN
jgi:hypothetical protein